jgi:hypothetical protein
MMTVKERGQFVATMRYVEVWLMETLAAWVPTTPEMEVKLLFGEHIWDVAQHADALGKRTFELRMPLQHSLTPAESYVALLTEITAIKSTPQRLAVVYDVMLPALVARYRRYLDKTDTLADAPSVRLLDREIADVARMVEAARALRQDIPALQIAEKGWPLSVQTREAAIETIVAAVATPQAIGA